MFDMPHTLRTPLEEARIRFDSGWRPDRLLGTENLKLLKGAAFGWKGAGLSMAPGDLSGYEVCASRSEECTTHCLYTAGRGLIFTTQWARIVRAIWYFEDRKSFMRSLMADIDRRRTSAIRLNVLSDIMWERKHPEIFKEFPDVQFYDYTKHYKRMLKDRPDNYHLTFSVSENNHRQARDVLAKGHNVAAVLAAPRQELWGYPVLDGDEHDLRFLDPKGHVVGLIPKGSMKRADSTMKIALDI